MNRYMIVIPAKNRSFVLKCDEGDGAKLETLQKLVSGYVETVPSALDATWAREEAMEICQRNAKKAPKNKKPAGAGTPTSFRVTG